MSVKENDPNNNKCLAAWLFDFYPIKCLCCQNFLGCCSCSWLMNLLLSLLLLVLIDKKFIEHISNFLVFMLTRFDGCNTLEIISFYDRHTSCCGIFLGARGTFEEACHSTHTHTHTFYMP